MIRSFFFFFPTIAAVCSLCLTNRVNKHVTLVLACKKLCHGQRLIAFHSPCRSKFDTKATCFRYVGDKDAVEHVSPQVFLFLFITIIPLLLHATLHLSCSLARRTKGAKPGNLQSKQCSFFVGEH